ncbi:MAG: hypothetical protein ABH812_01015 [bacterium]
MEFAQYVTKRAFIFISTFILVNLLILNFLEIRRFTSSDKEDKKPEAAYISSTEVTNKKEGKSASCPNSCISAIQEATSSSMIAAQTPIKIQSNQTKEYYLPIGSGSEDAFDWTDVPGLSIYVNPANYNNIKSVVFEGSVTIPNAVQDVWLRLYNSTDKHPVWFSDLSFPSGTKSYLQISQYINFDAGNKLYSVQMKTQLGATANVDQARIKITAN